MVTGDYRPFAAPKQIVPEPQGNEEWRMKNEEFAVKAESFRAGFCG